jgi:hypothetical protein
MKLRMQNYKTPPSDILSIAIAADGRDFILGSWEEFHFRVGGATPKSHDPTVAQSRTMFF